MKHHDLDQGVIGRLPASVGGGVSDGDYGDIIVSASGAAWTLDTLSNLVVADQTDTTPTQVATFKGAGRSVPANADSAYLQFNLENGAGTDYESARLGWRIDDITAGVEDTRMYMDMWSNGARTNAYTFARDYLYMRHTDLYYDQYGSHSFDMNIRDRGFNEVVSFRSVASAVNQVLIGSGITGAYAWIGVKGDDANVDLALGAKGTGSVVPLTNDGFALGNATYQWSDLWLASGARINFNGASSEYIEHIAGQLTFVNGIKQFVRSSGAANAPMQALNTFDSATVKVALFDGDRATFANNDTAYNEYRLSNNAGTQTPVVEFGWMINDIVAAAEDGFAYWKAYKNGSKQNGIGFNPDYFQIGGDTIYFRGYDVITNNVYIRDYNYNEILTMDPQASAVNNLGIRNAATGNKPIIEALGDDTNIGIDFRIKGSGEGTLSNASGTVAAGWGSGYFYTNGLTIFGNDITPAQITANQNDYAPAGYDTCTIMRISSDAYRTITSIAGGTDGRILILCNVGSFQIDLEDQSSALGTAANRIITYQGGWHSLYAGDSCVLMYDATSARWRIIATDWTFSAASQSQQETATSTVRPVTPGRQHFHPSAAKCWGQTTGAGTPTLSSSYNMTSITDTAVGRLTVTIANDFSSANWAGTATSVCATNANRMTSLVSKAAGSVILESSSATATLADPGVGYDWAFFGDL